MKFGSHISIAEGIENTPINAQKIGAECFQIFTKSPQGGNSLEISNEKVKLFKANLKKANIQNFYIHTPYYINLASDNNRIYYGAIKAIRDDLERGLKFGAKYVITHIGSAKDFGKEESIKKAVAAFEKILDGYNGATKLLIENSAGAGNIIGDKWEEIAAILSKVKNLHIAGICFDTAHSFESGYDLRGKDAVKRTMDELDKCIGVDKIKVFHANDSMTELASHKDRHANIGKGHIGLECFREIISDVRFKDIDMVLETPKNGVEEDLRILKELRSFKV